ncbi:ankyrin repeat domain-containing protein [Myxococcaceae bacterium GXIMD 01537]
MSRLKPLGAALCAVGLLALGLPAHALPPPRTNTPGTTALFEAVLSNDLPAVRKLLRRKDVDVNGRDHPSGLTALIYAANVGTPEMVKLLLAAGADPAFDDGAGQNALAMVMTRPLVAVEKERSVPEMKALLELLCRAGAKPDMAVRTPSWYPVGVTPTHLAVLVNPELVTTLAACGAPIDVADATGRTPLHLVLMPPVPALWTFTDEEASERVKALLDAGAKVDLVDTLGFTPLMLALWVGHVETAQLLIDRGASLELKPPKDMTMLMLAARAGHLPLFQKLLAAGADPKAVTPQRLSVLHCAMQKRRPGAAQEAIVRELLARGADPLLATEDGLTPLMLAAGTGNLEVWKQLVAKGGDVKAQEKQGATVLMYAAQGGNPDIVSQALERGADVSATDQEKETALHRAARASKAAVVEKLLAAGAPINALSKWRQSPIHVAVNCRAPDAAPTLRALIDAGAEPGSALETAARCEQPTLHATMLDALATRALRASPPAEVDALLWAGGKTEAEAQVWLAGFQRLAPTVEQLLQTAPDFPRMVASDSLAGLNPGFQVVLLGFCPSGDTESRLKLLKALYPGAYAKRVQVPLARNACPLVLRETSRNTTATFKDKEGRILTVSGFDTTRSPNLRTARFQAVLLSKTGELLGHDSLEERKYRRYCEPADYEEDILPDKRGLKMVRGCANVSPEGERPKRARDVDAYLITDKGTLEFKTFQTWQAPPD